MDEIQTIIQAINDDFQTKSEVRDRTLKASRELIRYCANAIRATHRADVDETDTLLATADAIARQMIADTTNFPDIYHAGYTQDALKEWAEAHLTRSLLLDAPIPTPESLGIENAAYINGLAEAVGELRRYALDTLRRGEIDAAERTLGKMDDIYTGLITVDFPSAITRDLRRKTDIARSIVERTRGDITTAVRQESMKQALQRFEQHIANAD